MAIEDASEGWLHAYEHLSCRDGGVLQVHVSCDIVLSWYLLELIIRLLDRITFHSEHVTLPHDHRVPVALLELAYSFGATIFLAHILGEELPSDVIVWLKVFQVPCGAVQYCLKGEVHENATNAHH